MDNLTGIIRCDNSSIIFSADTDNYCFDLLSDRIAGIYDSINPIKIEPKNGHIFGTTHKREIIAISSGDEPIYVRTKKHIFPGAYFLSIGECKEDDLMYFDGISFYGGTINTVFYMGALKINSLFTGDSVGEIKNDGRKYIVKLIDETILVEVSSGITINNGVSNRAISNAEALITLKFSSPKKLDEAYIYYRNMIQLLSFMTYRKNVGFDKVCLLKNNEKLKEPVDFAEMHVKSDDKFEFKDTQINLSINVLGNDFSVLMGLFFEKDENRKLPSLGFIPLNNKDFYYMSLQKLKEICAALEYELQLIDDINVKENETIKELSKEVKKYIKEYIKNNHPIPERSYNSIMTSVGRWSLSLKDLMFALRIKYEKEIEIFNNSKYIIDDNAINDFVDTRNDSTHNGKIIISQKVADTAFCLAGVVYCCVLERIGVEREKITEICKYHLLR